MHNGQISSSELLFWLSSSVTIRSILKKQGTYTKKYSEFKKRILPVFILRLPHHVEAIIDNTKQVVAQKFIEPAGGWLDSKADASFEFHIQSVFEADWPNTAVLAVRSAEGGAVNSVSR